MASGKWLEVLLFCLSVWRFSRMATEEDGPANVFTKIREATGAEDNGIPMPWDELSSWGRLTQCPFCISMWLAFGLLLLKFLSKDAYHVMIMAFAGSAATVLIEEAKQ